MSWHYSQALVEACSGADFSVGNLSPQLNSIPTVGIFFSNDKTKDTLSPSQSGTILEHSTGDPFVDVWTSLQPVSPVKDTVPLDINREQQILEISGLTPYELLGKWNPNTSSWKTSLNCYLTGISQKWPEGWHRAGIVLNGKCYRRQSWERRIVEIDSGLWPTPTASDWKRSAAKSESLRKSGNIAVRVGGYVHPEFLEWMMGFPIGWSAQRELEMHRFQEWLDLHGAC